MNQSYDLLVYGATPCGIAAACTAAEEGARVLLAEPSPFIGGHLTSGICTTECEHMLPVSFSGWMMKFLSRIGRHYGIDAPLHRWEPKVAEAAYRELLYEAGVEVATEQHLRELGQDRQRVRQVTFSDNSSAEARLFIDAGYEGDLMAMAGVPYAIGRESVRDYGESYGGLRFVDRIEEVMNSKGHALKTDLIWEMNLRRADGGWVEGVLPVDAEKLVRGEGDGKVMNYHYRITVTRVADRIPFPKPEGYREERYELLARWLHQQRETCMNDVVMFLNHPSGRYHTGADGFTKVTPGEKWELNNHQASVLSLGYLGGQFAYPDGDAATRRSVIENHYNHNAGLLYFLANSGEVPAALREEVRGWGLPPDEYPENGHWPYQPYIREARRMKGAYFLTQQDVLENREKEDGIFLNTHWIDSHHVQRLALDDGHFRNEGRIWHEVTEPYAIPYRSLLPKPADASNLLVPGCVSASHVAFCSVRLESTWMGLGEAAGCAAALALVQDRDVGEIEVPRLRQRLRERGVHL